MTPHQIIAELVALADFSQQHKYGGLWADTKCRDEHYRRTEATLAAARAFLAEPEAQPENCGCGAMAITTGPFGTCSRASLRVVIR